MGKVKQINNKNWTYCWSNHYLLIITYNDQINLRDFDGRLLKVDKKDYKKIEIYYIGYVTAKTLLIEIILTV